MHAHERVLFTLKKTVELWLVVANKRCLIDLGNGKHMCYWLIYRAFTRIFNFIAFVSAIYQLNGIKIEKYMPKIVATVADGT